VLDVLPSGTLCNQTGEGDEILKNGNCSPAAPCVREGNSWLVSALSCPNNLTEEGKADQDGLAFGAVIELDSNVAMHFSC
jgi:hypothetical protein